MKRLFNGNKSLVLCLIVGLILIYTGVHHLNNGNEKVLGHTDMFQLATNDMELMREIEETGADSAEFKRGENGTCILTIDHPEDGEYVFVITDEYESGRGYKVLAWVEGKLQNGYYVPDMTAAANYK